MFNIIAVVLGVAAIVVYYKGVRNETAWGTKLMTVLVIGAVLAVIIPLTPLGDAFVGRGVGLRYQHFELMGRELRGELDRGDNVLVLVEIMDDMMMQEGDFDLDAEVADQAQQIKDAVASGARTSLNLVGSENLQGSNSQAWNNIIDNYENDGVKLIITQAQDGLPVSDRRDMVYELDELACFGWTDPPLIAADLGNMYNPEMIREYLQDGKLSAVTLRPARGEPSTAIGRDNIDDVPDTAPVGPFSDMDRRRR